MTDLESNHQPALGILLSELAHLVRRELDRRVQQTGLGLTRAQWLILHQLSQHDDCLQRELAESLRIEASTVGRHIERLLAAGWLERSDDTWDGRAYRLHLRPKALRALEHLKLLAAEWREEYLAGIPPTRREALVADLLTIQRNLLNNRPRAGDSFLIDANHDKFQPVR